MRACFFVDRKAKVRTDGFRETCRPSFNGMISNQVYSTSRRTIMVSGTQKKKKPLECGLTGSVQRTAQQRQCHTIINENKKAQFIRQSTYTQPIIHLNKTKLYKANGVPDEKNCCLFVT